MTKYKGQKFSNTFKNARKGMWLTIRSERNIKVHFCAGILALLTALLFDFSISKLCIIIIVIASVISAEMFNSAIEFALDSIYHNKYSRMVGMAKDIAAGAVMVVTISSVIIGLILFVPPIFKFIFG